MGRALQDFVARTKRKGYKKLLTGKDTVPTAREYEKMVAKGKSGNDIIGKIQ